MTFNYMSVGQDGPNADERRGPAPLLTSVQDLLLL